MTHPGPELTEYVDGTLTPSRTARIDEHLRTCATCRAEVGLAIAAREALAATPSPAPPPGLADAAIAEARELAAARTQEGSAPRDLASHRPRPTTPRWLAIAGAAAVIALVALIVPKLGQPGAEPASLAAGASDAAQPAASAVEVQHVDYGANFLPEFAAAYDSVAGANVGTPAPVAGEAASPGPISTVAGQGEAVKLLPERLPAATRCLDQALRQSGRHPDAGDPRSLRGATRIPGRLPPEPRRRSRAQRASWSWWPRWTGAISSPRDSSGCAEARE